MVEQVQVFEQARIAPDQGSISAGADAARPLSVHDPQGNVINENVHAPNVKVWSSGQRDLNPRPWDRASEGQVALACRRMVIPLMTAESSRASSP